jgi:hypothetical protein
MWSSQKVQAAQKAKILFVRDFILFVPGIFLLSIYPPANAINGIQFPGAGKYRSFNNAYASYFIEVILLVDMLICARVFLRVVSPKFGKNLEIF